MESPTTTDLSLIPLSSLPNSPDSTTSSFLATHAPPPMIKAVWATLQLLGQATPSLNYAPAHFALISSKTDSTHPTIFRVQSYLDELTRAAFEVSTSLLCSSVLAGRSSESDEYGDVGVWVGALAQKDPENVLKNLGLADWVKSKNAKVRYLLTINFATFLTTLKDCDCRCISLVIAIRFDIFWVLFF